MKIILTIALVFIVSACSGQQNHKRYFKADINYYTMDGCHEDVSQYMWAINSSPSFDHIYNYQLKWCGNHKIDKSTFHIYGFKEISLSEYKLCKNDKFKPCSNYSQNYKFVTDSLFLGTIKYKFTPIGFSWYGISGEQLSISSPDSNKIVTVKFSKSKVHFINDSTFTIKQ